MKQAFLTLFCLTLFSLIRAMENNETTKIQETLGLVKVIIGAMNYPRYMNHEKYSVTAKTSNNLLKEEISRCIALISQSSFKNQDTYDQLLKQFTTARKEFDQLSCASTFHTSDKELGLTQVEQLKQDLDNITTRHNSYTLYMRKSGDILCVAILPATQVDDIKEGLNNEIQNKINDTRRMLSTTTDEKSKKELMELLDKFGDLEARIGF